MSRMPQRARQFSWRLVQVWRRGREDLPPVLELSWAYKMSLSLHYCYFFFSLPLSVVFEVVVRRFSIRAEQCDRLNKSSASSSFSPPLFHQSRFSVLSRGLRKLKNRRFLRTVFLPFLKMPARAGFRPLKTIKETTRKKDEVSRPWRPDGGAHSFTYYPDTQRRRLLHCASTRQSLGKKRKGKKKPWPRTAQAKENTPRKPAPHTPPSFLSELPGDSDLF